MNRPPSTLLAALVLLSSITIAGIAGAQTIPERSRADAEAARQAGLERLANDNALRIREQALDLNTQQRAIDDNAAAIEQNTRDRRYSLGEIQKEIAALSESSATQESIDERTAAIQAEAAALEAELDAIQGAVGSVQQSLDSDVTALREDVIRLTEANERLSAVAAATGRNENFITRFWILVAAILVLLMQAGFTSYEVGVVRSIHADNVGMKNLIDWLVVVVVYFVIGFGLMFGASVMGVIGSSFFMPSVSMLEGIQNQTGLGLEFFLFELAFAATAATIVSGALAERTTLVCYLMTALFMSAIAYPIFGHWAWGSAFLPDNGGWLYDLGFRDFAGSTVVHCIGAWVAWVGIAQVGARQGRFRPVRPEERQTLGATLIFGDPSRVNREDFSSNSIGYSVLGVFLLWFGWWGFNGGSLLRYDGAISSILLNTNIAGAFGGLTGFFLAYYCDREDLSMKTMGGALGGLVGITACCNIVSVDAAILIGILSGIVHHLGSNFLLWLGHDDPVGAIPVHGFCGVLGTLCVAFFADPSIDPSYFGDSVLGAAGSQSSIVGRLVPQLIGIVAAAAFAGGTAWAFFKLMASSFTPLDLRVGEEDEATGTSLS